MNDWFYLLFFTRIDLLSLSTYVTYSLKHLPVSPMCVSVQLDANISQNKQGHGYVVFLFYSLI